MIKQSLPVLPLRDIVVFPHMVAPLFVGRKPSVNALNNVMIKDKQILLITQKNSDIDNPKTENLYKVGTLAKVLQLLKLPDGTIKVLVEGLERVKIVKLEFSNDFLIADYSILNIKTKNSKNIKALIKIIIEQFESYQKINKKISSEIVNNIKYYTDFNKLADVIIGNLSIKIAKKQELLEMSSLEDRLNKINGFLVSEIDSMQNEKKNQRSCKKTNGKNSERILLK